jgi:hypothetical protein
MIQILKCRRSSLALIGLLLLFILGMTQGKEVAIAIALPIAGIIGSIGAANAYEKKGAVNVSKPS